MSLRFRSLQDVAPVERSGEHNGHGPLSFRRMLTRDEFAAQIDFVDVTLVPPGTTIGRHDHAGNEEIYIVIRGEPLIVVNGEQRRLERGGIAVVRSGEWHELRNDTSDDVEIAVVQVSL